MTTEDIDAHELRMPCPESPPSIGADDDDDDDDDDDGSDSSSNRPPSSLLYEKLPPTPPIITESYAKQASALEFPDSSNSPEIHSKDEPAALRPTPDDPSAVCYTYATTVVDSFDSNTTRTDSQAVFPDAPNYVSRRDFPHTPAVGNPDVTTGPSPPFLALTYPPRHRDPNATFSDDLWDTDVKSTLLRGINVGELLERYSEEGAELVEMLAEEDSKRKHMCEKATATSNEIASLKNQERRLAVPRKKSPEESGEPIPTPTKLNHLSPEDMRKLSTLESQLAEITSMARISRASSEGTIAGHFDFRRDEDERDLAPHEVDLLKETGLLCGHRLPRRSAKRRPVPDNPVRPKESPRGYYDQLKNHSPLDILSKERMAFEDAYYSHGRRTTDAQAHEFTSQSSNQREVLVPDWFDVFTSYGVLKFSNLSLKDRFNELLNTIFKLEQESKRLSLTAVTTATTKSQQQHAAKWDKHWHDPNPLWPSKNRQMSGG